MSTCTPIMEEISNFADMANGFEWVSEQEIAFVLERDFFTFPPEKPMFYSLGEMGFAIPVARPFSRNVIEC